MSYFKPNTAAAIKLATAIKGLTATMATMVYVQGSKDMLFAIMLAGAIANEAINFLSDGSKPEKPGKDFPEH